MAMAVWSSATAHAADAAKGEPGGGSPNGSTAPGTPRTWALDITGSLSVDRANSRV